MIEGIRKKNKDILISVDTYRAKTAEEAIKAGADIINDISAMTFDDNMAEVAVKYDAPVILMHIKGTPKDYFKKRIDYAISKGIKRDKIILDPGIGFGKNYDHNIELIKKIDSFYEFNMPILLAVSRKTFIGLALGNIPVEERLEGTIAVSCFAAMKNVDMIRVHDVLENKKAIKMIEVLK